MKLEAIKFSFVYCFIIEYVISIPECSFISFIKDEKIFLSKNNNLLNLNNFLKNDNLLLSLIYIIIPKI